MVLSYLYIYICLYITYYIYDFYQVEICEFCLTDLDLIYSNCFQILHITSVAILAQGSSWL